MNENDESFDAFAQEMGDVRKITKDKTVSTRYKTEDTPGLLQRRLAAQEHSVSQDPNYLSESQVHECHPLDIIAYKRPGLQNGVFKKLRLGHYDIEARLDLHNKTMEEARQAVFYFVQDCMKYDLRTVLICHGKGERSKTPAKLKSHTAYWLEQIPEVMAYHSAQKMHGGVGALYVLLKKSEKKKAETREKYLNKKF